MESIKTSDSSKMKSDFPDKGHFEAYQHFASQMRTWLIAYGIGAPVLFISQPSVVTSLKASGCAKCVVVLFLAGVSLQVTQAWMFKASMWYQYLGELNDSFIATRRHRCAVWISDRFWPEFLFDLISIAIFSLATYKTTIAALY